jgi:hypothetical protein
MTSNGTAASATNASGPATSQSTTRNNRKNGKSATAEMVVEVSSSRTCSTSRTWAMKEPVDLERASVRRRSAWPNTTSDTLRSARLPITSEICVRDTRSMNSKTTASITPPNSTHSVGSDCAGTTRS